MRRNNERPTKHKNPREGYTFSHEQKQAVIEEAHYQCEHCGSYHSPSNRLEIHHIVAVFFARECNIPHAIITSLLDASAICHDCHTKYHRQESRYQYAYLAWFLFSIDVEYNESKDDWRKDPNHPINRKLNQ